ncbi:vesicular-fusion protein S17, partial [Ascosphaera pollenicola]
MPPAPAPGAPSQYADADPWRQAPSRQSISSSTSYHQQQQHQGYRHSRPITIYSTTANHSAPANAHPSAVRPNQPSPHPSCASASGRTVSAPVHVQSVAAPPPRSSVMTPASATSHSQQSQPPPQPQSHSQLTGPCPIAAYNSAHTQSQAYSSSSYGNTPAQLQSTLAYHSQYPRTNYAPVIAPVDQLPGGPGGPGGGGIGGAESTSSLPYRTHSSMASSYDLSADGPSSGLMGPNSSSIPLQTVPVDTPSNRRGVFANSIAQQRRNEEERNPFYQPPEFDPLNFSALPEKSKPIFLQKLKAPRIYDHCVKGLESGIPTEVEFALHHLVIISDERGDKFRFCDFPGLADSLLEAAWEITYLVHGVSFEISYDPISPDDSRINVIDGCYGTPDLVARIIALPLDMKSDGLEPVGLGRYSRMVSEAALVIHNMCTLEENAIWLADMAAFKDWVVYLLNMPEVAREKYVEIVNNALETAEMVAPFWVFEKEDGFVPGLLECLKSGDRTHLVLALRVFVCWGMDRPDARKEMCLDEYMTSEMLTSLCNTLLLEQDRELLSTVLDFLYQYTSVPANVAHIIALLDSSLPISLIPRLTNLLLFEAEPLLDERIDQEEIHVPPPNDIPDIPPTLHAEICRLPEPDRCSAW